MDDTTKHQPCYSDITACLNDYQWKTTNITMVNGDTYLLFLFYNQWWTLSNNWKTNALMDIWDYCCAVCKGIFSLQVTINRLIISSMCHETLGRYNVSTSSHRCPKLRGPVENPPIFWRHPWWLLSAQINSNYYQYYILKLWLKKNHGFLGYGGRKVDFLILGLGPKKYPVCIRT